MEKVAQVMGTDFDRLDAEVRQCLEGAFESTALVKGYFEQAVPGTRVYELHVDGQSRRASISRWEVDRCGDGAAQEIAKRLKDAIAVPDVG